MRFDFDMTTLVVLPSGSSSLASLRASDVAETAVAEVAVKLSYWLTKLKICSSIFASMSFL